jgi:O-antigen/teichoic acid export membrane protein
VDYLKLKGFKALAWDFIGKLARNGTSFIVTIILARLLEPSEFGLIAMIMVFVGIAFIFSDVGLGAALIQRRRVLPIHYNSVFYFNTIIGLLLTAITFFSAPWIAEFYHTDALTPLAKALSFLFFINSLSSVQNTRLRKTLDYATLAKANVGAAVLSGCVGVSLAFYGAGVWSLVAQALSRGIFYNLLIWRLSQWLPGLSFSFKALKQLWGFGFRMFLSGLLEVIYIRLDIIIIGRLFSPSILGFFELAKRLNEMIVQYSSGSIMAVLFPVLSKVQNDLPRFQNIAIKTLGIISFILFFLLGLMYVIAEDLITVLFTDKWLPSVTYFKIILLSAFSYPLSALLVNILSSRGNSKVFLRLEIYKKVIQTINLYVGFLYGIEGYLYGLIIVSFLSIGLNIHYASREIHLSFMQFIRPILTQMAISLLLVFGVIQISHILQYSGILSIALNGFLFTLLYLLINWLLQTSSYRYCWDQILPLLAKKFNKGSRC